MKKLLCSAVLAFSLALPTAALAEPQPNMKEALEHLRAAKVSLEKATADKGGHRVKAIEAINHAIEQVEKGIEFDNKH